MGACPELDRFIWIEEKAEIGVGQIRGGYGGTRLSACCPGGVALRVAVAGEGGGVGVGGALAVAGHSLAQGGA